MGRVKRSATIAGLCLATLSIAGPVATAGAAPQRGNHVVVPKGWKTYKYGAATISVPKGWHVVHNNNCPESNTLLLGYPNVLDHCPNESGPLNYVALYRPLSTTTAATQPVKVNGVSIYATGIKGQWGVPSLGVNITALGPNTSRILHTLRRAAGAPTTVTTVPAVASSAPACTAGHLTAQYRGSQGAAGNLASGFWIANTGTAPCQLSGTVSVELIDAHGASRTASHGVTPPIVLSTNGAMPAPGQNPAKGATLASVVLFWPTIPNAVQSLGGTGATCPQPLFQATSAHITFSGLQPLVVTDLTTSTPAPAEIPSMCGSDMSVMEISPLTAP
jgi:hypothetical protein